MRSSLNITVTLIFVLCIFSCKNETSTKKQSDESLNEITMVHQWTDDDKKVFLNNCIGFLQNENVSNASQHCDCLLETTLELQPEPKLAMAMNQVEVANMFQDSQCLQNVFNDRKTSSWNESIETSFLSTCIKDKKKVGLTEEDAQSYCDCALGKLIVMIPHPQHVLSLTEKELQELANSCE